MGAGANFMILLVEDDVISRADFAETLRRFGYEVLEAAYGAAAIDLLEKHRSQIDLMITDMVMPGVNGLTLVRNIQARWPKLPVIMVSAYLSKKAGRFILGERINILEKPIRPSALVRSVGRIVPRPVCS
jgi:CheY-like chemotaxis protein